MTPQDVFVGSPPLAFTFGLGGLAVFPLRFGATATLLENASPANMIDIIETYKATISFTSPTAYRAMMAAMDEGADLSSLRMAISAGETLPAPVFEDWTRRTGKPILDGIGTTELLHIFISNRLGDAAPGATGPPCHRVRGQDRRRRHERQCPTAPSDTLRSADRPAAVISRTIVRPAYVRDGLNLTGDDFVRDDAGVFHFVARADDMIISAGYNIAGPEVEGGAAVARGGRRMRRRRRAGPRARADRAGARGAEGRALPATRHVRSGCRTTSRRRLRPTSTRARSDS